MQALNTEHDRRENAELTESRIRLLTRRANRAGWVRAIDVRRVRLPPIPDGYSTDGLVYVISEKLLKAQ
jgi:hypothetical protein